MKNIQLVLIIAILVLIYLISMQWLWKDSTMPPLSPVPQKVTEVPLPPVVIETPANTPEVIEEVKVTPEIESVTPEEGNPEAEPVVEEKSEEAQNPDLIEYKNANYGYHFSIPDQMYYAGFGARNGALHTLAIQPDSLPEVFWDATVRVSYYGKKILPELQNTERYVDPNGKYILILIDGAYSVRIESDNLQSPTVKAIEETIGVD